MNLDELRTMVQTPHPDLHYALWSNLDDSSWIARDLAQAVANLGESSLFNQIGQLGITATLVILGIMMVFLDGMYEDLKSDEHALIGQME